MVEFHGQRPTEGGLLISEATTISIGARGWLGAPGLSADEQVAGWRQHVNDAVHVKGGRMFSQFWHVRPSSSVAMTDGATSEIASIVADYGGAATRAKAAGCDGVELHGANGRPVDPILQDNSNRR